MHRTPFSMPQVPDARLPMGFTFSPSPHPSAWSWLARPSVLVHVDPPTAIHGFGVLSHADFTTVFPSCMRTRLYFAVFFPDPAARVACHSAAHPSVCHRCKKKKKKKMRAGAAVAGLIEAKATSVCQWWWCTVGRTWEVELGALNAHTSTLARKELPRLRHTISRQR